MLSELADALEAIRQSQTNRTLIADAPNHGETAIPSGIQYQ